MQTAVQTMSNEQKCTLFTFSGFSEYSQHGTRYISTSKKFLGETYFKVQATMCPIWYETWDEMTLNLFFPMYAQFCLGRLEFGRFGWNMKINAGEYVGPFSHHFTSFPRNLCGTYIASFKFIQIPQIKATNMSHSKFHNSERRECTGQCK